MRTSFRLVRSCVFSTSVVRLSTFWLTSPTSRLTYFLVAQPDTPTPSPGHGTSPALMDPSMFERVDARPRGVVSGLRHITAPGPHHDALAGGADLDAAGTGRAWGRPVAQRVLELKLRGEAVGGFLQGGEVADGECGAPRERGVAGEDLAARRGRRGTLLAGEAGRGRVVVVREDGQGGAGGVE